MDEVVWTEEEHRLTCRDPGKASGKVFERPFRKLLQQSDWPLCPPPMDVTAGVGVGVME